MRVFSWKWRARHHHESPMDSIRYYKHFSSRRLLMSMEPQSGHVKAWVGGFNYKHFQYDQVKQGRRQIGSTFKPFLIRHCDRSAESFRPVIPFPDALYCIDPLKHGNMDAWCPKNSGDKYGRSRTLKDALGQFGKHQSALV